MATMLTTLETFRSKDMQKAYQVLKDYGCRVQFFGSEESGSLSVCDLHHSDFMISVDRVVPESKQSFLVWSPSPFVTYKVLRDAKGNEVRDKFGRYQYEVQRDADGNPMKDKYGHPVYVPEPMVTRSNDDMLRLALSDIVKTSRQYANIDSMVKFHSDYLRTYEWHEMSSQEIKDYKSKLLSVKKRLNSLLDDLGIAVPVAKKETADEMTVRFNKKLEKTQTELGLRKQAHKKAPKMKDIVDDAQVDMADLFAPSKSAGHSKIR